MNSLLFTIAGHPSTTSDLIKLNEYLNPPSNLLRNLCLHNSHWIIERSMVSLNFRGDAYTLALRHPHTLIPYKMPVIKQRGMQASGYSSPA